jgi:hypothetical protein
MGFVQTWTPVRAKAEFDQLLEAAKSEGPQEIRDGRGSFTVKFNAPKSSESVTEFLSKGLPDD